MARTKPTNLQTYKPTDLRCDTTHPSMFHHNQLILVQSVHETVSATH